ncbi:hypothetical protein L0P88_10240 [Muricauda sp. SCSIO 64092]|uniref:hypothetical protein n=1 Tax=Allomuricauda sp. SCSIO 64092 TaxID=2908842 RepID=UPI001FF238E2|nr:hypothetical protein [Muricauda sp. SCSIO 64092]UOY08912.1 hypothetical protein L0P88_10240 [Muricauda sp. SCSIO 64092]
MNSLEGLSKFLKESAENAFVPIVKRDFGEGALLVLGAMNDNITLIYKNLRLRDFTSITVFAPLVEDVRLSEIAPSVNKAATVDIFASVSCKHLVIEVLEGQISYCTDWVPDIEEIRNKAIVYCLNKDGEVFYGKTEVSTLPELMDTESYFQHPTYKDLEEAFEEYELKRAKNSSGPFLKNAWHEENRIFFVPGPESIMRDCLHDFLSIRLRGSPEVMPEQYVDRSRPVDIKVTWTYSSHVALIEVKWVGKSYDSVKDKLTAKSDTHARSGADQLVQYLDNNKGFAFTKIVSGYLVVFDGRRWNTNKKTTEISAADGGYYRNKPLKFDPEYEKGRTDFEKPIRFFMEPIVK